MRVSPALTLVITFLLLILAGTAAFLLFGFDRDGGAPRAMAALFTSTSAVCVTGLTVVDLSSEMGFRGQLLTLLLIQIGGLGLLTLSNWILLSVRGRIGPRGTVLTNRIVGGLMNLSPSRFLHRVMLYTFACEAAGTALLFLRFLSDAPPRRALWLALFHSVSAFCNAGFTLFPDSLAAYRADPAVNGVVILLILAGGIGFVAAVDAAGAMLSLLRRRPRRLSFHTRTVLVVTAILVVVGFFAFLLFERGNTFRGVPAKGVLLQSLFLSVTARTAGFNTVPTGHLTNMTLVVLGLLMVVGASPGSTGGGVKTTAAAIVWAMVRGQLTNRPRTELFGRTIPFQIVAKALAVIILYVIMVVGAMVAIQAFEYGGQPHTETRGAFLEHLFEVISALSTVGLSTGATNRFTDGGLGVLILCMFAGRVGPLVLASSLIGERKGLSYSYPEADIMVG
ncbi:MAG: potassium transporter TrkH [Candidatus Eisenbacteria bacterium]|nr:potassium transporter TrkH [Candidatus Eisenbacteria bacterium]